MKPDEPQDPNPPTPSDRADGAIDERPAWARLHLWQITAVRDVFWIALVVSIFWVGAELSSIFTPLLIGLAFAYLFHPVITACEDRWNMPRPLTISLILLFGVILTVGLAAWLGPKAIGQIANLAENTPRYLEMLQDRAAASGVPIGDIEENVRAWADEVKKNPSQYLAGKAQHILAGTGAAVDVITGLIGKTVYLGMCLMLIPMYFFFFAWQFGPMVRGFKDYLPAHSREKTLEIIRKMDAAVATYFRDRVVIGLMMSVMFSVGWAFCGVPSWLLLGVAAGMLSLIPYASMVIWPLAVLATYLDAGATAAEGEVVSFMAVALWPTIVYGVVQIIESYVLTPLIQGKSMEMSVVTIIVVMFIGSALAGLYGLLLCIPVAACIKILLKEVYLPKLKSLAQES